MESSLTLAMSYVRGAVSSMALLGVERKHQPRPIAQRIHRDTRWLSRREDDPESRISRLIHVDEVVSISYPVLFIPYEKHKPLSRFLTSVACYVIVDF